MSDRRRQFVSTTALLWVAAFVAGALVSPPDPFTQLVSVAPLLLVSPLLAYWLVYRDGASRLRDRLGA
ncbi:MAG: hypothetical protein ABEJ23_07005 [Haloarculaceae archaeon]